METTFYCRDCDTPIEADEIDDHEESGHIVQGRVAPKRLLPQDPWDRPDAGEGGESDVSGDSG